MLSALTDSKRASSKQGARIPVIACLNLSLPFISRVQCPKGLGLLFLRSSFRNLAAVRFDRQRSDVHACHLRHLHPYRWPRGSQSQASPTAQRPFPFRGHRLHLSALPQAVTTASRHTTDPQRTNPWVKIMENVEIPPRDLGFPPLKSRTRPSQKPWNSRLPVCGLAVPTNIIGIFRGPLFRGPLIWCLCVQI